MYDYMYALFTFMQHNISEYSHAITNIFFMPPLHSGMHTNPFTAHFTLKIFFPKKSICLQFAGKLWAIN